MTDPVLLELQVVSDNGRPRYRRDKQEPWDARVMIWTDMKRRVLLGLVLGCPRKGVVPLSMESVLRLVHDKTLPHCGLDWHGAVWFTLGRSGLLNRVTIEWGEEIRLLETPCGRTPELSEKAVVSLARQDGFLVTESSLASFRSAVGHNRARNKVWT
jgi:hypothetical protein